MAILPVTEKIMGCFWGFVFFPLGYPFDPAPLIVKILLCSKGLFELLVQIPTLGRRPSMLGWGGRTQEMGDLLQLRWPDGLGDGAAMETRREGGSSERRLAQHPGQGGRIPEPVPSCCPDGWVTSAARPSL